MKLQAGCMLAETDGSCQHTSVDKADKVSELYNVQWLNYCC